MYNVIRSTYKIVWGIPNELNAPFMTQDYVEEIIGKTKTYKAGWDLANKDCQNGHPVNIPTIKNVTTEHYSYDVRKA